MFKKNVSIFFLILLSVTSQLVISSQPGITATFSIVPNSMKDTKYNALITLVNNGPALSRGWQLEFNFSSSDQIIEKVTGGNAQKKRNPIIINNTSQHIRTAQGQKRTVRLTISKDAKTVPSIPVVTVVADTTRNNNLALSINAQ
jgi:hypothetical protein